MRYEGGGAVQAFIIGDVTVCVDAAATLDEVRAAFEVEIAKRVSGGS